MRRILLGVTIDDSLQFHAGLPEVLVKDGWEVHIVATPGRRMSALGSMPGVVVHPLPMDRTPNPLRDLKAFFSWMSLIRRVRPQQSVIGTPKAALLGNIAARLARVPRRVYVMHGLRLETVRGLKRFVLGLAERLTVSCATDVLAVSPSLGNLVQRLDIVHSPKLRVLGWGSTNGVDLRTHREARKNPAVRTAIATELELDRTVPVIGYVGRLTRDKGLPELTEALRLLSARRIRLQVLLVGAVDDSTGQRALQELQATGQRILAIGYRENPAPYFTVMDLFCFPSLREGLGNVVLEAMASSVAVVAADSTGLVDLVESGKTGYLVPRGSASELAHAIERAISDRPGTRQLSDNALKLVEERYPREVVLELQREYLGEAR